MQKIAVQKGIKSFRFSLENKTKSVEHRITISIQWKMDKLIYFRTFKESNLISNH